MGLRERLRARSIARWGSEEHGTAWTHIDSLSAEAADAIDRLMKYARHDSSCDLRMFPNHARDCDCGLFDLIKEIGDD